MKWMMELTNFDSIRLVPIHPPITFRAICAAASELLKAASHVFVGV